MYAIIYDKPQLCINSDDKRFDYNLCSDTFWWSWVLRGILRVEFFGECAHAPRPPFHCHYQSVSVGGQGRRAIPLRPNRTTSGQTS